MHARMLEALAKLSLTVSLYFPAALKQVLLDQAKEIDRLRAEVNEMRSIIERDER